MFRNRETAGMRGAREKGFSSLEVMFCITFFSIAFLGAASSTLNFSKMRKLNAETQTALTAAKNQMEIVRGTTFASIYNNYDPLISANSTRINFQVDLDGNHGYDLAAQTGDADGNAGEVVVTKVGPVSDPSSLLQIVVTVAWRGVAGNRSVTLTELISNRAGT